MKTATVRLGDIVKIVGGGTPNRENPAYWGGKILWATVKDLTGNALDKTEESITEAGLESSAASIVPAGSIIMATRMGLGKVAINSVGMAFNQDLKALFCGPVVDKRYLLHFLSSKASLFERAGHGATVKGVKLDFLRAFKVPLPPLAEQRRIAAILDKADTIRQRSEAALREIQRLLRATFLGMFGDPNSNPRGWPTKRLGDIASFIGGGTPRRNVPAYYSGKICWATSKDMHGETLSDTQEHITEDAVKNSATKLVPPGSLLIVVKSKILMHSVPVLRAEVPTCFGQDLKAIVVDQGVSELYVARHLRLGPHQLLSRARGVNTEGLTLDHLRDYRVMVPPPRRIDDFVAFERKLTATCSRIAAAVNDASSLSHALSRLELSGRCTGGHLSNECAC